MKILRKKRVFKSYKEMCAALEISPAPRGREREEQKLEIQKHYEMSVQKNNSIELSPSTKRVKKIEEGQLLVIDGKEVDLCSRKLYANTGVYDYILYVALSKSHNTNTKEGFIINCFKSMRLFNTLLVRGNYADLSNYQAESLKLVDEYIMRRLNAFVTGRLNDFEKKGLIKIDKYYETKPGIVDKDGNTDMGCAELCEVQSSVNFALEKLDLHSEYEAYSQKDTREKFIELRNERFKQETNRKIIAKRFYVYPNIQKEEIEKYYLTNKECQVILTSFYDVMREKLCFNIEHSKERETKKIETKRKICYDWWHYRKEAQEIIREYCAYMTSRKEVFYSLDDLGNWEDEIEKLQALKGKTATDLDFLYYDNQISYGEDELSQKNNINYYALSNITEEILEKERKKMEKAEEYFKRMYPTSENTT